ncbi:MAG: polysaccharide biosynthesis protein [Candidatus Puniceispirillaceae bacterium]
MNFAGSLHALESLPRWAKQLAVVAVDILLGILAMWLAYTLRLESWHVPNPVQILSYGIALLVFLPVFVLRGIYKVVFRYVSVGMLQQLFLAVGIYGLILLTALASLTLETVPRSVALIQPVIFLILLAASRVVIGALLYQRGSENARRMLIYGAGAAGSQLVSALSINPNDHIFGFLDDDSNKHGRRQLDRPIYDPAILARLVEKFQITDILLALPSATHERRRNIVESLIGYNIRVSTMPGMSELVSHQGHLQDTQPLSPDDFLPRPPLQRSAELRSVKGKTVLVTGAGGSIGSEICRQLIKQDIKKLIVLDQGEYNLYMIDSELRNLMAHSGQQIEIATILADIRDARRLEEIFATHHPQMIYHAAAYKHVPLVEANPFEAIQNNFLGTEKLASLARRFKAERFVLISTDKAVRPTNIMGASKRLAELSVQAKAAAKDAGIFTMVRFGNVIGSSGSAIPLFQSQIARGGPVTVTDPEVTRYFMSITEAVMLVLEAGEMAKGGEVFVLDMGQPIKVVDLVRRMIRLYGKQEKSETNPGGDIAISFIGLRPGEKMYEELILGDEIEPTTHPRISQAQERFFTQEKLESEIGHLEGLQMDNNISELANYLKKLNILVKDET